LACECFFIVYEILVVCELLVGLEWARKCWSTMGMNGHMSASPSARKRVAGESTESPSRMNPCPTVGDVAGGLPHGMCHFQ
jgi:hypothetical protein